MNRCGQPVSLKINYLAHDKEICRKMDELIKSLSLFINVSPQLREEFVKRGKPQSIKKGTIVHSSDKICNESHFIVSGILRIYSYREDKEITEDFNGPGEWSNANRSFMFQQLDIYNVDAITDVEVITLSHKDYMYILNNYIELNAYVRNLYDYIFVRLLDRLTLLRFSTAKEKFEIFCKHYSPLMQDIPLYHIASFMGITPETLSRIRKTFP